jgi:hypothetical protein
VTNAETRRHTDDADRPVPPRYWWLKRILLAVGVLILALAGLRWWWGHEAERRFEAKIDEYRAADQPVTIEDFQFPSVPDEENAAKFLMDAKGALVRPPAADAFVEDLYSYPEGVVEHADAVGRWVAANAEVLRLVRAARSKDKVDWGLRFRSPVINMLLPQLDPQRQLGKFLCTAALYQHHTGDDAAAVDTLRDAFAQANKLRERGVLLSHLVAIATDALAVSEIEVIAPTLRIASVDKEQRTGPSPARPEQVRALLAELLNEEPLRESWRWAMYGERLCCLDNVYVATTTPGGLAAAGAGGFPASLLDWLVEPTLTLDAIFMMDYCTTYGEAGVGPDYPNAQALMMRYPAFRSGIERSAHFLSSILLPSFERALLLHFRAIAMHRLAATALAIRLYEIHHGRRPASLDQLIPDYLPAVPADPFTPDGRPIGYRPHAPKPVLYSVGPDGIDDGGEYGGAADWDAKDLVFFLNGDRPRCPPASLSADGDATEGVEDEADEVGDRRQPNQDQPADEQ